MSEQRADGDTHQESCDHLCLLKQEVASSCKGSVQVAQGPTALERSVITQFLSIFVGPGAIGLLYGSVGRKWWVVGLVGLFLPCPLFLGDVTEDYAHVCCF